MIDQAMLMAAGLGTRLRPFTDLVAKPLLPLMGVPMAQFALDQCRAAGVRKIVANVHHLAAATGAELSKLDLGGMDLSISDESSLLLGSAGGLRHALSHFGGKPFYLVNADVVSDVDLAALGRRHERLRSQWGVGITMTLFRQSPPGASYRRIHFDESTGLITRAGELGVGVPFYVGAAVIEPEAIASLPEGPSDFVPSILAPLIERGRAGFYLTAGRWHDMGSPDLWLDAHVSLLAALETGALSALLRARIENGSERVSQLGWASRDSRAIPTFSNGPSYWSGPGVRAPREFGPRVAFYGEAVSTGIRSGIGFGGKWWGVPGGG